MSTKLYFIKNYAVINRELRFNLIISIPIIKLFSKVIRLLLGDIDVLIISKEDKLRQTAHLSLLISSKKATFRQIIQLINQYESICKKLGIKQIHATVVNKRISSMILSRYNWTYISKHWYFGNNYSKII